MTDVKDRVSRLESIRRDLGQIDDVLRPYVADTAETTGNDFLRATALFPDIVEDFLEAAQLIWLGEREDFAAGVPYESAGAELVYIDFPASDGNMSRRRLGRRDGQPLDGFQHAFLLEFQTALITVIGSLGKRPDRLVDYISQGLVEQAVAGVVASIGDSTDRSLIFSQRLLWALKKLLLSTYEGEHATISILVVPTVDAHKLRWTRLVQDGIGFLRHTKIARALSDAQDSVFAFSAVGEFYGLFDRRKSREMLGDSSGIVEWRIQHAHMLSLAVDGRRRLELFSGAWRYVDDDAAQRILSACEPSFADDGPTRVLWDLAVRLSEAHRGALILVVSDPSELVHRKCCKADEVNLPGGESRVASLEKEYGLEPGDGPVIGLDLKPKDLFLEQFFRKSVDEIGIGVLSRLAGVDGALVVSASGEFCGFGIILSVEGDPTLAPTEGARTRAALLASSFGVAIKISDDGPITIYAGRIQVFPQQP